MATDQPKGSGERHRAGFRRVVLWQIALLETGDAGETWSLVRGLFDHPHRPRWMPGNGELALHTILLAPADNQRMYVAISAGGVYRSNDGGGAWTAQNQGVRAMTMPDKYPEFGQCIHKIGMHPARPERLFLRSHWGLYRSANCAETWLDMSFAVHATAGCESIEPATVAPRGSLSCAACRRTCL